jgi:hypothetical protein
VEVTTGIGIFKGGDNGFAPQDKLQRDQAAKLVAYILLGDEADSLSTNVSPFSDVTAGNWAAGYINYCVEMGIIAGDGTGKYNPYDQVTGQEFAKMVLCALGYDATIESFTNNSAWGVNATRVAKQAGLTQGLLSTLSASALTREEAAQVMFRALSATRVYYTNDGATRNNDDTYLAEDFGLNVDNSGLTNTVRYGELDSTTTGVVVSSGATVAGQTETGIDTDDDGEADVYVSGSLDVDMIGHTVKVYRSASASSGVYATYGVVDLTTEIVIAGTETSASAFKAALKAAGVNVTTNVQSPAGTVYQNGVADAEQSIPSLVFSAVAGDDEWDDAATTGSSFGAGTILVYNGNITGLVLPTVTTADVVVEIVTTEGKETITLSNDTVLNNGILDANGDAQDVVNEYDGIAEGDVVLVVQAGEVYNLTKATTVEGTVTKKSGTTLTVNGTDYAKNDAMTDNSGLTDVSDSTNFTDTFTLYLDADGNYFAVTSEEVTATVGEIVYVVTAYTVAGTTDAYGNTDSSTYAQVVKADGTTDTILIGNSIGGVEQIGETANGTRVDRIYIVDDYSSDDCRETYAEAGYATDSAQAKALNAAGVKKLSTVAGAYDEDTAPLYSLALVADTYVGNGEGDNNAVAFTTKTTAVTVYGSVTAYVTDATNFVFVAGKTSTLAVEVVTAGINSDIKTADTQVVLTKDEDGNVLVSTVFIAGTYTNTGVTADDLIYVVGDSEASQSANGYSYTIYNASTGVKSTVDFDDVVGESGYYAYKIVDGVYSIVDAVDPSATADNGTGAYTGLTYTSKIGTSITADGGEAYDLTDKAAGSAVIVDLRTSSAISSTNGSALTTLAAIQKVGGTSGSYDVTFDCYVTSDGVVTIFITALSARES